MATLRLATDADVPSITALIQDSVRALSVGYYTPAQIDEALQSMFGLDSQLIRDRSYFLLEADGGVVVAAGGWSRRSTLYGGDQMKRAQADPLIDPEVDAARLRAFFVSPAWARRGLARRLYAACAEAAVAHGFRRMQLRATMPGVPLYEALGFRATGRADHPMPSGELLGIVCMERDLP